MNEIKQGKIKDNLIRVKIIFVIMTFLFGFIFFILLSYMLPGNISVAIFLKTMSGSSILIFSLLNFFLSISIVFILSIRNNNYLFFLVSLLIGVLISFDIVPIFQELKNYATEQQVSIPWSSIIILFHIFCLVQMEKIRRQS